VYEYTDDIILAVNVAIATGRPLLVCGKPGTGKSSLASSVARHLGWCYYEEVITSRTQAQDLLWRHDGLRRLNDAQAHQIRPVGEYIEPGVLWWAFDANLAKQRGAEPPGARLTEERQARQPRERENAGRQGRAVVLLDEIDKADPDVPNDLLVPIGSLQFEVKEIGTLIKASAVPLIILTSNNERRLADAFMRRCVVLALPRPTRDWLVRIARAHFGSIEQELVVGLATKIDKMIDEAYEQGRRPPSIPEFLDAIRACRELGIKPDDSQLVHCLALLKTELDDEPFSRGGV
jgi:MoxR-like ATPase